MTDIIPVTDSYHGLTLYAEVGTVGSNGRPVLVTDAERAAIIAGTSQRPPPVFDLDAATLTYSVVFSATVTVNTLETFAVTWAVTHRGGTTVFNQSMNPQDGSSVVSRRQRDGEGSPGFFKTQSFIPNADLC